MTSNRFSTTLHHCCPSHTQTSESSGSPFPVLLLQLRSFLSILIVGIFTITITITIPLFPSPSFVLARNPALGSTAFIRSIRNQPTSLFGYSYSFSSKHTIPPPVTTTSGSNNRTSRTMVTTNTSESSLPLLDALDLPSPLLLGSASFTRKLILKERMGIQFVKCVRPIDEKAIGDRSSWESKNNEGNDHDNGQEDGSGSSSGRASGKGPETLVLTLACAKMDHLIQQIQSGMCEEELTLARKERSKDHNLNKDKETQKEEEEEEWIVLTGDQVVTCNGKILEKPESIEEARSFVAEYRDNPPSTVGSCVLTHLPSGIQVAGVDTATIYFSKSIPTTLIDKLVELDEPILSCAGGLMIEHTLTKEHLDHIDGTEESVMGLSPDLVLRLLKELKGKLDTRAS